VLACSYGDRRHRERAHGFIAFVDEAYAPKLGFHNNAVVHFERPKLDAILAELPDASVSAGGGVANAMRAASYLGAAASFAGMVGEDDYGSMYEEELAAAGLKTFISRSGAATGIYCALIRPDGGRTLLVAPGAALDISLEPPSDALFLPGALLYLECFLLSDRAFFMDCLRRARASGMEIAMDLASRSLTAANREFILALLSDYCDVLFANEDEFVALSGLPLREGLELFADQDMEVLVKRAEMGAVWAKGGRLVDSPVREMRPVDETGAGDAFAAGFLYGRSLGLAPERSLRLGNRVAEEILGVPGFGVDPERVRRAADSILD
jgi:sugar/nucleoside kinase (ribokinase family)